ILFVFRNCRVELVPRLRVRSEDLELRTEPTRVIQTTGIDSDNSRCALALFPARQARAALGAKTTLVMTKFGARREMIAWRATRELERIRRHNHDIVAGAAARSLAIAAVAAKHGHWFGSALISDRAARAAAGERKLHVDVPFLPARRR